MDRSQRKLQLQQNCELLRISFNVIQSLIRERSIEKGTAAYCDMFNLSLASKYIFERWELEKRQLAALGQPMILTTFEAPAELPVPQLDAGGWSTLLQHSSFYNQHFTKK